MWSLLREHENVIKCLFFFVGFDPPSLRIIENFELIIPETFSALTEETVRSCASR